jgi:hypothetical protein
LNWTFDNIVVVGKNATVACVTRGVGVDNCEALMQKLFVNLFLLAAVTYFVSTTVLPKAGKALNYVTAKIFILSFGLITLIFLHTITFLKEWFIYIFNLLGLYERITGVKVVDVYIPLAGEPLPDLKLEFIEGIPDVNPEKSCIGGNYMFRLEKTNFICIVYTEFSIEGVVKREHIGLGYRVGNHFYTANHVVTGIESEIYVSSIERPNMQCKVEIDTDYEEYDWDRSNDLARFHIGNAATALGIKSTKFGLWKDSKHVNVCSLDKDENGEHYIKVSHTLLKDLKTAKATVYGNESSTKNGDSGAPILQGGCVVATHAGSHQKLPLNVCVICPWKAPDFLDAIATNQPLLRLQEESVEFMLKSISFESKRSGFSDESSTKKDDFKYTLLVKEQREAFEQEKQKRSRGEHLDDQGYRQSKSESNAALSKKSKERLEELEKIHAYQPGKELWGDVDEESARNSGPITFENYESFLKAVTNIFMKSKDNTEPMPVLVNVDGEKKPILSLSGNSKAVGTALKVPSRASPVMPMTASVSKENPKLDQQSQLPESEPFGPTKEAVRKAKKQAKKQAKSASKPLTTTPKVMKDQQTTKATMPSLPETSTVVPLEARTVLGE